MARRRTTTPSTATPCACRKVAFIAGRILTVIARSVRFKIALGRLENYPTHRLDDFTDRLLEMVPTLNEHGCSYGEKGGFVRRLRKGTWLAHVAEHVAIELQCLAATPVTYGKTRGTGETGVYNVVYSYLEEHIGLLAGWMALRLINHLLPEELKAYKTSTCCCPTIPTHLWSRARHSIIRPNWKH
jgi:cyanophycin synthetase